MSPYQLGGAMIQSVSIEESTFLKAPQKFEAGTPHVAGAIGMGAAIDYISDIGKINIKNHCQKLVDYCFEKASSTDEELEIYSSRETNCSVFSFNVPGVHHGDLAHIMDQMGVAVRAGHHCCQPLMSSIGIKGTVRASFSLYNELSDVDRLFESIKKGKELLK